MAACRTTHSSKFDNKSKHSPNVDGSLIRHRAKLCFLFPFVRHAQLLLIGMNNEIVRVFVVYVCMCETERPAQSKGKMHKCCVSTMKMFIDYNICFGVALTPNERFVILFFLHQNYSEIIKEHAHRNGSRKS